MRFNAVRKQLRASRVGDIYVADAANDRGFWHMEKFAADYRMLFGENPSTTLECDAKPCTDGCSLREHCQICER